MRHQLSFEISRLIHSKTTRVLALILVLLPSLFWFWARYQNVDNARTAASHAEVSINANLSRYNDQTMKLPENKAMYNNLIAQWNAATGIPTGIQFGAADILTESTLELAELQQKAYSLNRSGTEDLVLPSKIQLADTLLVTRTVLKQHKHLQTSVQDASSLLKTAMKYGGSILFFLILLFAMTLGMDRWRHPSLLRDLPVPPLNRLLGKLLGMLLVVLVPLTTGLGLATLWIGLVDGFGDLTYPLTFNVGHLTTLPLIGYLALFLLAAAVLTIFTALLAMLLNRLTKSVYLTLFIGLLGGAIGQLWTPGKLGAWLPFSALDLTKLLAQPTATAGVPWWGSLLILLGWSLVMTLIVGREDSDQ
ncbi:hypothetical protein [Lacticaseibacillus mingshuiensis]|uniref:ABC transporter permease n=1 Tax=Lacticaseibacillus mingshuiensis TaxID=2799574 RepID=A0ABW4CKQ9_9LACO|nr:hypothetical protein [Lacticaseibacillus mingshuiensis]